MASLTLPALRFGCGSPLFGIQKSVGAGKLPVLRDQNAAFSPAVNMFADHCHDDLFGIDCEKRILNQGFLVVGIA